MDGIISHIGNLLNNFRSLTHIYIGGHRYSRYRLAYITGATKLLHRLDVVLDMFNAHHYAGTYPIRILRTGTPDTLYGMRTRAPDVSDIL